MMKRTQLIKERTRLAKPPGDSDGRERKHGGRPLNAVNKRSKEAIAQARLTGKLPHEILLSIARGEVQEEVVLDNHGRQTRKKVSVPLSMQKEAAQAAAPYYAPKISTVEVISGVGDDDLNQLIAQLAAEAGVSLTPSGKGTPGEGEEGTPRRAELKP